MEKYEKYKTVKFKKMQEDFPLKKPEETKQNSQLRFSKKELSEFVDNYLNTIYPNVSKWGSQHLFYGNFITNNSRMRSLEYAHYDNDKEKTLLLFDGLERSIKNGFVITDSNFYYIADGEKGKVFLEEISNIKFGTIGGGLFGFIILINETMLRFTVPYPFSTKELDILQKLFIKMSIDILKVDVDKPTKSQYEIFNTINNNLIEDENVIHVAWNIIDRFFITTSGAFIICTNYRLIVCQFDSNGFKQKIDYPYDTVTSISNEQRSIQTYFGDILSSLKLCDMRIGAAQSVIKLEGFKCSDVDQIEKIITERKQKIVSPNKVENSISDSLSISEEIMKLKNLLDNGLLTQEEFNKAKKKLLD
jgi:hypothetical protein